MKPASTRRLVRSSNTFAAAITALLASQSAHAASQTWTKSAGTSLWDAASLNWSGAAWTNGNDAVFGATGAGAITVSGTRSVGNLTVSSAGYSFNGGILSVANVSAANTWAIGNDTTIASGVTADFSGGAITGSLVKTGTGTLTLSGAVSSTGFGTTGSGNWGITVNAGSLELSGTSTFSSAGLIVGGTGNATISAGTHNFTGTTQRIGLAMGGGRTVTVSGGTVNTVALTVGNGSSGIYTQTGGTVTTPTTGGVVLGTAGNSSSTSVFNLDGGSFQALQIAPAANWLGTSTINLNGGTFKAVGTANTNLFSATEIFVKAGGAVIDPNGRDVTISSSLLTDTSSTGGGLTKLGGGGTNLTLSGANTYTGTTTIAAGGLIIGRASTRSGTTIVTGATGTGDVTLANSVRLGESSSLWYVPTLTLQGNVTLEGNLRQQVGFKTLDLDGGTRTISINPTSGNIKQTIAGNTALEGTGRSRWETLNDIGALTVQNGNLVLATNLSGNDYAGFMFQKASQFAGNAGLTVGANVHLQTVEAGALGSTTANTAKLTVNGIWNLSASTASSGDQSVYSLAGSGKIYTSMVATNANARTITLNGTAGSTDFSGVLSNGPGTGKLSIVKDGASSQTLSGTNSYSGTTAVSAGTLIVSGSIGNSAVTVENAGTILASGATGTIGKGVTVNNGAILAAGNRNAAGTATVNGATTLNNGSIFSWDISSTGTSYDNLVTTGVTGEATAGDAVFQIVVADAAFAAPFWSNTQTWTDIFTTNGATAISNWADLFSLSVVNSSFASITPVNGDFTISGSTLTWTAVPEPTSALAGLLLGAGLLRRRRN